MSIYIGMDAHSKTSVFVAVNSRGKELASIRTNTSESGILSFLRSLSGRKSLAVEESHITNWVFRTVKNEVDQFVAFDASQIQKRKGPKDDFIDARNIAHQLRGNFLTSVFHEDSDLSDLRTIVSAYRDVVRDGTRLKNRYKAIFRSNAIDTTGSTIYSDKDRVDELTKETDRFVTTTMYDQLAQYEDLKSRYDDALKSAASRLPVIKLLSTIPGISTVRASIIASVVCSPQRFRSKHEFWSYSMLVKHHQVSDGVKYGSIKVAARSDLKEVFVGAAETAIQGKSELRKYYDTQIEQGKDHRAAKRNVARKIAAISLAVMRNETPWKTITDRGTTKRRNRIS